MAQVACTVGIAGEVRGSGSCRVISRVKKGRAVVVGNLLVHHISLNGGNCMKIKTVVTALTLALVMGFSTSYGADPATGTVDLVASEKKIFAELNKEIPADQIINVEQFKKIVDEVNAGTRKAYLLDLRSAPEFYTFHIDGADNIHAGHVYTIPKKITDANAEIYIYCRTSHRAFYIAHFMKQYGYTNFKIVKGGMVAWLKAGYPVVNQYMGKFVAKYENFDKDYNLDYNEAGKYRVREFHPY